MLRTELVTPTREESTKYSVNGVVCAKEDIHATILQHEFYDGVVDIEKKYHFKLEVVKVEKEKEESVGAHSYTSRELTLTSRNKESEDHTASFNMNTNKFVSRFDPAGDEYKLLVSQMVEVVDCFYAVKNNYLEYAEKLDAAVRQCMTFAFMFGNHYKSPFDNLMAKLSIESTVFLFNVLGLTVSKLAGVEENASVPEIKFDMSCVNEEWDESWTDKKKSRYLRHYLSVMLNQADLLSKVFIGHDLFTNASSNIKSIFDDFKMKIVGFQAERAIIDASLGNANLAVTSNPATQFHFRAQQSAGAVSTSRLKPTPFH